MKPVNAKAPVRDQSEEDTRLAQIRKNQTAIELLREWIEEGDEEEQRETGEYLMKALEEDRLSNRKFHS